MNNQNIGMLIVFTGASGAGKDTVMDKFLEHEIVKILNIQRVITCTDRQMRKGESQNAYHFLTRERLDQLAEKRELVEDIVDTGTSRKATSKSEIARLLKGENLLWRIDPSRAADVTGGNFFNRYFSEHAQLLKDQTLVICINAPKEVIETRRKSREGENYNPGEFSLRDNQEAPHLDILMEKATIVENIDGKLEETVQQVVELVINHHAKIKNK